MFNDEMSLSPSLSLSIYIQFIEIQRNFQDHSVLLILKVLNKKDSLPMKIPTTTTSSSSFSSSSSSRLSPCGLVDLPTDLVFRVLQHTNAQSALSLAQTDRHFFHMLHRTPHPGLLHLWRAFYRAEYPHDPEDKRNEDDDDDGAEIRYRGLIPPVPAVRPGAEEARLQAFQFWSQGRNAWLWYDRYKQRYEMACAICDRRVTMEQVQVCQGETGIITSRVPRKDRRCMACRLDEEMTEKDYEC